MKKRYINRLIEPKIKAALDRGKSILFLGARQTGKTTLINNIDTQLSISFINPAVKQKYEINPAMLIGEVEAIAEELGKKFIVVIDEVQKVPEILDAVQYLIDNKTAQFILTGSSARKLRKDKNINLLPGRVVVLNLDPLTFLEAKQYSKNIDINDLLIYGSLPGVYLDSNNEDRLIDLESYVSTYLEEEIRLEAIVRNVASFSKFLPLAASESGEIVNFSKISQEIGVAHTTIASYYNILEDCLIAYRVEPYVQTKFRRKLTKSAKYLFFDLGVRQACINFVNKKITDRDIGKLFEHWVGLEFIKYSRLSSVSEKFTLHFWRDPDGPEVDWVLVKGDLLIPVEVKWTSNPSIKDAKHLKTFMSEYENVNNSYIVCQVEKKIKLEDNIYAIPWQELHAICS